MFFLSRLFLFVFKTLLKLWEFNVLRKDNLFGSTWCPFNHFLAAAHVKEIYPIKFEYADRTIINENKIYVINRAETDIFTKLFLFIIIYFLCCLMIYSYLIDCAIS